MEITTYQLGELIEDGFDLFDFEYPVFSDTYKTHFEKHFIEHFYYDEIGLETLARFKQRLAIKLNLIMPYWNKILMADALEQRILDNYDVTETFTKDVKNNSNATNESTNKNLNSDTPTTKVDFEQIDYFSSIMKDIGQSSSKVNGDSKETWTRTMQGNIGVQTDADAIIKYWQSLRKIELEIFDELSTLFMGVY